MQEVNSDFNPRDPHGSRRLFIGVAPFYKPISIHATLTGRDHRPFFSKILPTFYFNPRDPHGSRPILIPSLSLCCHFNPRDPHGSRLTFPAVTPKFSLVISIHATLTGRDGYDDNCRRASTNGFQSTRPSRVATHSHC